LKRWLAAWGLCIAAGAAALAAPDDAALLTPVEQRRGEEQTFLTYPEWYLVHSPAELAAYLGPRRAPSEFPWGGHVAQFWQGYAAVTRETANHPFNAGYHLRVSVIGGSTTVEYTLRSAYESTIGRLSEASASGAATPEDALAARVAQQYVDFIRVDPWYLFDFVTPLKRLWLETPWSGPHGLRKWERRYLLTTEWLLKAGYAWLIKRATGAIYEPARPVTAVVLSREPAPLPAELNALQRIGAAGSEPVLVTVPRYEAFMAYAQALADQGIDFREIAGNRGPILVSVWQRTGGAPPPAIARQVLTQPILTQPEWERQLVALPVADLAAQLRRWRAAQARLEHIYDY
jgi:hypothetical protein